MGGWEGVELIIHCLFQYWK